MEKFPLILVASMLTCWVHLAHCQSEVEVLIKEVKLFKTDALKGIQDLQQKQNEGYEDLQQKLNGYEELLQKIPEMEKKLDRVENNLQELRRDLEHVKGAVNSSQDSLQSAVNDNHDSLQRIHQEVKDCLGREDLESFKNISSAGQQELESSLRQEISGVISLLETGGIDECSEGGYSCGDHEACTDKLFKYGCSCVPGFARNGSRCEDIDECAQGKVECSPQAACRNSVGSYSCSCNPPFQGDGRTCCPPGFAQNGSHCDDMDECAQGKAECSPQAACRNSVGSYSCSCNPPFEGDGRTCEFSCESPAKVFEGVGCVKLVREEKSWQEMKATCQEAGWRLLQDFSLTSLQEVRQAFGYIGWFPWIGVYEGKWLETGIPLLGELWKEGYRADPSKLCGVIAFYSSSSLYLVGQRDCSEKSWGFCQLQL